MGEKVKGQRKRQDWWLRLSFWKENVGWGKRAGNSNSWKEAGDKSDRLDKSQVQGEMGLFGESCRSRSRVGQWLLPMRWAIPAGRISAMSEANGRNLGSKKKVDFHNFMLGANGDQGLVGLSAL